MIQETQSPNMNAVWIALIGSVTTMVTTLGTFWMTQIRQKRIEAKADVAALRADQAAVETVKGNEAIAEVHKVVNGRTDALIAENKRLVARAAAAEAEAANRRSTDP